MSNHLSNKELLISDTLVPDIFITSYIQELSKDAICLYMWLLMIMRNNGFKISEVSNYSVISASDRDKAFSELLSSDLVYKSGDDMYFLSDLKMKEVEEYCNLVKSKSDSVDGLVLSSDKDRDVLAGSINKTFYLGKMSFQNYRLIDKCLYEYKFDSSVIYRLFETAVNNKQQYKINYLQNMAEDWFKKGYTTPDKLLNELNSKKRVDEITKRLGKLMRKRLDGLDIEKIEEWVNSYDVSVELVEHAYRCNDFRGTITLRNVGDKLKEWFAADIKSIDQAVVYEKERHNENKIKASRRKSRSNNWKTGAEMGIMPESKDESPVSPAENASDDDDQDEILNLFGGIDENN